MASAHQMEEWDEFVGDRYDPNRKQEDFRKFDASAPAGVREFYRLNHSLQTRDFVLQKKRQYGGKQQRQMAFKRRLQTRPPSDSCMV